jgi:hypothetical protein
MTNFERAKNKIMRDSEDEIRRIIFEYGVGMVADEAALFMGSLSPEDAQKSQGKKTAETIDKVMSLLAAALGNIYETERT